MATIEVELLKSPPVQLTRRQNWNVRRAFRLLYRYFALWLGLAILSVFIAMILVPQEIATHDPEQQDVFNKLQEPNREHRFGTDALGRDVFSRVVYGTRVSLPAATAVVITVVVAGSLLGAAAGFFGGLIEGAIMRVADVTLAFPGIVLALAIASLLGPSLNNMLLAACLVLWPEYARLMRSQVLVTRNLDYIMAARSYGTSEMRILLRHVMPNSWTAVIVKSALDIGNMLLLLAALSFFGLGADPTTAEWGAMIADGQKKFPYWWWLAVYPGVAIFIVVLAFNLVSEGLRNWLDPNYK